MRVDFEHKSGRKEKMELRYAKVLSALSRGTYMTRDMRAQPAPSNADADELAELRAKYQEVVGKKAYHGWDADELREKISEHEL